ncbi:hypothetical protein DdX_21939 [Ditylenchus destructor]|uniref:Uncharacterized protein n=1 Tax=Ditylenchus destructor TaxID=166010 RepID=A0AAD4ME71_9BILA|nr:hypothetical protein DdX_21939 [Ditylenchus destructor]
MNATQKINLCSFHCQNACMSTHNVQCPDPVPQISMTNLDQQMSIYYHAEIMIKPCPANVQNRPKFIQAHAYSIAPLAVLSDCLTQSIRRALTVSLNPFSVLRLSHSIPLS